MQPVKSYTNEDTVLTLAISVKTLNAILLALNNSDTAHKVVSPLVTELHRQGTENLQAIEASLRKQAADAEFAASQPANDTPALPVVDAKVEAAATV